MRIDEASKILAQMYAHGAATGEKAVSIHLFGIKYANEIRDMSAKEIVIGADLPKSYKTEIRKGINLAKYVEIK
jgi:5-methylcytosine-specific restriction protein B